MPCALKKEKSKMSELTRIHPTQLHAFVQAIWLHAGSNADEARLVADHLVAANLAGHDSHGVGMIPSYMTSFSQGHLQLNQHPVLEKDAGAVLTFHARGGFGQVAAFEAMQQGIARARQTGIAAVGLHHSHHIGRIGHWAEQCAAAGFISFHFVNVMGDPMVAPFGGSDRRFGTIPSAPSFRAARANRYCLISPPAASPSAKHASPGTKGSMCRRVILSIIRDSRRSTLA